MSQSIIHLGIIDGNLEDVHFNEISPNAIFPVPTGKLDLFYSLLSLCEADSN